MLETARKNTPEPAAPSPIFNHDTTLYCGEALMKDPRRGRRNISSFRAFLIRFSEAREADQNLPVLDLLIGLKSGDRLTLLKNAARWHKSADLYEREAFDALAGGLLNMATESVLKTGKIGAGFLEPLRVLGGITGGQHIQGEWVKGTDPATNR